ncbi:Lipoprotein OS=Castellaniella defragrans OX=75697 GN=HNR28_002673 PE=4 SV=1 [Castellaniella defragrans]
MRAVHLLRGSVGLAVAGVLTACAPTKPPAVKTPAAPPACVAVPSGDALVGNWLSVASEKGVAGSLRTLYTLNVDGTMSYVEQIKRPRTPSQGLYETGCWSHEGQTLTLRTLASNGSPVNLDNPIYVNRYRVDQASATELRMRGPDGAVRAKRMSPGYRLPF